jgi:glycosyltransferase involved in cell wall biosynthesis
VLAPANLGRTASVLFTHNVEAEIFQRHAQVATDPLRRWLWGNQNRKMRRFESAALRRFDRIVAVSDRDRAVFAREYAVENVSVIPTGVNLEYFSYRGPGAERHLVFIGSMDWMANVDAVEFLMQDIWPTLATAIPDAQMTIVGRSPPDSLIRRAQERKLAWHFTGRVDDVRPYAARAAACLIPMRVGGGTRIKAFEAMAMGTPVISTTVGVEGLQIEPDLHYRRADTAAEFAAAVIDMLRNPAAGRELAQRARRHVEAHFSNAVVGRRFEEICLAAQRTSPAHRLAS